MENVRIQDDLYNFVNGETIEKLVIPDDKPAAGGFQDLADGVEKIMMGEFATMTEKNAYPNEYLERACTLYAIAKDAERKAAHGIAPALKNLAILDEIKCVEDFNRLFKTLSLKGIPTPFGVGVETDMKNTKRHLVYIQGAGVILPDASYYKPEMEAQKTQILGIWTNVAKSVMAQTDLSAEDQEAYVNDTLAFDAILGGLVKTREEWSKYVEMYNPMDTARVAEMLSTVDFCAILCDLFGKVPETVGEVCKVVYLSLSQCYGKAVREMEQVNGRTYSPYGLDSANLEAYCLPGENHKIAKCKDRQCFGLIYVFCHKFLLKWVKNKYGIYRLNGESVVTPLLL